MSDPEPETAASSPWGAAPVAQLRPTMPETVRIGGVAYSVTRDFDDWRAGVSAQSSETMYGYTDHLSARIYINPVLFEDVAKLTLWHEVLHALCEVALGAPAWRHLGSSLDAREEAVVRMLESPTLLVLRDNPDLLAYLTAPS